MRSRFLFPCIFTAFTAAFSVAFSVASAFADTELPDLDGLPLSLPKVYPCPSETTRTEFKDPLSQDVRVECRDNQGRSPVRVRFRPSRKKPGTFFVLQAHDSSGSDGPIRDYYAQYLRRIPEPLRVGFPQIGEAGLEIDVSLDPQREGYPLALEAVSEDDHEISLDFADLD